MPPDDPGFLTAAYHRLRLTLAADQNASRRELDAILGHPDLSLTSRNLFLAKRAMVARDEKQFSQLALRISPCATTLQARVGPKGTCLAEYRMESYGWVMTIPDFGLKAKLAIDRMPLK